MVVGITGGSGFIGMHLIKKLLSNGYEVKVLALEDNPNFPKEVTFIKGDLVKKENLTKFLKEIDVLIHLAGSILPPDNIMMENNVMSTFNLISEALNYPIKHIVFTSSVAVYGKDKKEKFKEIDECFPNTNYGLSKYLAEKIVLYWGNLTGKPVTIFRPFNVYGPGNYKGIIYSFYTDIKNKNKAIIYGDGTQERDFMYVGDFVEVIYKAIKIKQNGIFNLGNLKKYSILEIFKLFKKIMKKDVKVQFNKNEEGKVFNINQDLSHIKKVLGWEAKTPIKEGLEKTIDWYEKR
ncbi:MAG: NAD(P)-dependent oxidoreductase [Patescibacteria group bacterium]